MHILFQGDSITDCGRGNGLGTGYALLCAAALGKERPGQHTFTNRGISGNRITDLLARWKRDCLNLQPDYLSILIGVNDVWHELSDNPNGVDAARFEKIYTMLIEDVLQQNPAIKLVLLEPYVLHGPATDPQWETFTTEVADRRRVVRRLAESYALPTIPLQDIFDAAMAKAPASCWSADGVHPTPAGHALIAEHWLVTFHKLTD